MNNSYSVIVCFWLLFHDRNVSVSLSSHLLKDITVVLDLGSSEMAAINIDRQVCVDSVQLGWASLWDCSAGSCCSPVFTFVRGCHTVFHSVTTQFLSVYL